MGSNLLQDRGRLRDVGILRVRFICGEINIHEARAGLRELMPGLDDEAVETLLDIWSVHD